MKSSGYEKLAAFEKVADAKVDALPIGVLPIRVFLAKAPVDAGKKGR